MAPHCTLPFKCHWFHLTAWSLSCPKSRVCVEFPLTCIVRYWQRHQWQRHQWSNKVALFQVTFQDTLEMFINENSMQRIIQLRSFLCNCLSFLIRCSGSISMVYLLPLPRIFKYINFASLSSRNNPDTLAAFFLLCLMDRHHKFDIILVKFGMLPTHCQQQCWAQDVRSI